MGRAQTHQVDTTTLTSTWTWTTLGTTALCLALTGCGGGGGPDASPAPAATNSNTPSPAPSPSPSPAPSPAPEPTPSPVPSPAPPPELAWSITPDSATYAGLLNTDKVSTIYGDTDVIPAISPDPAWGLRTAGAAIVLSTAGQGRVRSDLFLGDLALPAASLTLQPGTLQVQGEAATWYSGAVSLGRAGTYAANILRFQEQGITAVALGQWKFNGDYQAAPYSFIYNSGTRSTLGAFLVGTPTPPAAAARLTSGRYSGYLSASDDNGLWLSSYDQLTGKVTIDIDATRHRITMQVSDGQSRGASMSGTGISLNPSVGTSVFRLPQPVLCAGDIDAATGSFSCTFESYWSGTLRGQLYGAAGEQLGASFTVRPPDFDINAKPVLVGGLVARRVLEGAPASSGQTPAISPTRLSVEQVAGATSPEMTVQVNAGNLTAAQLHAVALDPQGKVALAVAVTEGSTPGQVNLALRAAGSSTLGVTDGEVTLRVCLDDAVLCRQPVLGSPWTLPYTATTLPVPGPNVVWVPSVLQLDAYEGLPTYTVVQAQIAQPAIGYASAGNSTIQYAYSIRNAGVLQFDQPTGNWDNQTPGTFSQGVLRVTVPDNVNVGLYQGEVVIDVFGVVNGRAGLPVAQPQTVLPYTVAVHGWTNLRPLAVPQTIAQLPNGRGNADARRSFPMALDPANFLVRWRAPLPVNFGAVMPVLGDGFVAGLRREDGLYILTVIDEERGEERWQTSWAAGEVGASEPVLTASNGSIQVREQVGGGFRLTVYNPTNGATLLQRSCSNCEVLWAQEYGQGWVARIRKPAEERFGLWIYVDRNNRLSDTTSSLAVTNAALVDDEVNLIRNAFFGGTALTPRGADVPTACDTAPSVSGRFWLHITSGVACMHTGWGGVAWGVNALENDLGVRWPGYPTYDVRPLEVNGQSLYLVKDQLIVRDEQGKLLQQFGVGASPYQVSEIARSQNIVFVSNPESYGTNLQAYRLDTQQVAWTLPVPGTVVGISNKGVLYVVAKFGYAIPDWRLVAINLLP